MDEHPAHLNPHTRFEVEQAGRAALGSIQFPGDAGQARWFKQPVHE